MKKLKSFDLFSSLGGFSLGARAAGIEDLGGVEINPRFAKIYEKNLKPKYIYNEDVRDFNKREDLPEELYSLDILIGSPPCTSFSMAGIREKGWGEKKKFNEGSKEQTLDDLLFVYADTIIKLKPKIAIMENVAGLTFGNARIYLLKYLSLLGEYDNYTFVLDASKMGVPQIRKRVFVVSAKKSEKKTRLNLYFNGADVPFGEIKEMRANRVPIIPTVQKLYDRCEAGKPLSSVHSRGNYFNYYKIDECKVLPTITEINLRNNFYDNGVITDKELLRAFTWPEDYDFGQEKVFGIGYSVPPKMAETLLREIIKQWFAEKMQ